jgi:carbon monoxide dehydrogenase subunit G
MSDDVVVSRSVLIAATPEEVWDALVEPSRLEEWFADEVETDELAPEAEVASSGGRTAASGVEWSRRSKPPAAWSSGGRGATATRARSPSPWSRRRRGRG